MVLVLPTVMVMVQLKDNLLALQRKVFLSFWGQVEEEFLYLAPLLAQKTVLDTQASPLLVCELALSSELSRASRCWAWRFSLLD